MFFFIRFLVQLYLLMYEIVQFSYRCDVPKVSHSTRCNLRDLRMAESFVSTFFSIFDAVVCCFSIYWGAHPHSRSI